MHICPPACANITHDAHSVILRTLYCCLVRLHGLV